MKKNPYSTKKCLTQCIGDTPLTHYKALQNIEIDSHRKNNVYQHLDMLKCLKGRFSFGMRSRMLETRNLKVFLNINLRGHHTSCNMQYFTCHPPDVIASLPKFRKGKIEPKGKDLARHLERHVLLLCLHLRPKEAAKNFTSIENRQNGYFDGVHPNRWVLDFAIRTMVKIRLIRRPG